MVKENTIIIKNDQIAKDIYEMTLEVNFEAKPGQFINIDVNNAEFLLRRPISIANIEGNRLTICYRNVGKGTNELRKKSVGELVNILGPLGNGFPLVSSQKVLIVGAGMGVAPMYYLAKELSKNNNQISIVLGYNDDKLAYYTDKFKDFGEVNIVTMDGSLGKKANVIEFLENNEIDFNVLYACGPGIVLKSLDQKYQSKKMGYLSYEERMACGIGACYGCVIQTNKGLQRVCKDGPIFNLGAVKYE